MATAIESEEGACGAREGDRQERGGEREGGRSRKKAEEGGSVLREDKRQGGRERSVRVRKDGEVEKEMSPVPSWSDGELSE